jgi:uncharacterized membrane protein
LPSGGTAGATTAAATIPAPAAAAIPARATEVRHHHPANQRRHDHRTRGERLADKVTAVFGSWNFIIIQTVIVVFWITLNLYAVAERWDPYPFILLNLVFSTQAAYAAPLILLSQNRQADTDRIKAEHDYWVNQKALNYLTILHRDAHGDDCDCPDPADPDGEDQDGRAQPYAARPGD